MIENKAEKIEMVNPDVIVPWDKNANKHSDDQIERLCNIIKFNGFRDPLIISKRSGFLICGHGRLICAKKLKLTSVPVIYQDFKDEAEEYQFMVSHNAIASWAELDLDMIKSEILNFDDMDIELLGLENFSIVDMALEDDEKDDKKEPEKKFILSVELPNEFELRDLYDDLISKGYMVKEV
jgi:hypothetical protein